MLWKIMELCAGLLGGLCWPASGLNADFTYLCIAFIVMNDQVVLQFYLFSQTQILSTPDINPFFCGT